MHYRQYADKELIRSIRHGSASAFDELYRRYWQELYTDARNVLRSRELARDIVQEVFASVWQKREVLEIEFPRAYLRQAVRFQVLNMLRSGKEDEGFYTRLAEVSRNIVDDNPLLFKELNHILFELIESMPEENRVPFILSREENLTYRQIADYLNISVKTVEKRMSQSLQYLRSRLDRTALVILALLSAIFLKQ